MILIRRIIVGWVGVIVITLDIGLGWYFILRASNQLLRDALGNISIQLWELKSQFFAIWIILEDMQ